MVKLASEGLKMGQKYTQMNKTIVINLLNFEFFKRNSFHNIAHMKFEKTTPDAYVNMGYKKEDETVTENLEMHFIEIPKFIKKNTDEEKSLNQWLWLISGEEEKVKMAKKENKEIKKAMEIIDEMSMDPKEWELYRSRQMALMDYYSGMQTARDEGIEERNRARKKEKANRNSKKIIKKGRKYRRSC